MLEELKKLTMHAENYAFNHLASNAGTWRLHPIEQANGTKLYFLPKNQTINVFGKGKKIESRSGCGHPMKPLVYPNPGLDEGPFKGS